MVSGGERGPFSVSAPSSASHTSTLTRHRRYTHPVPTVKSDLNLDCCSFCNQSLNGFNMTAHEAMWPAHLALPPLLCSPAGPTGEKSNTHSLLACLKFCLLTFNYFRLQKKKRNNSKVLRLCNISELLAHLWFTEIVW